MQALPAALEGRDLIGIAQTGSGKTLGYVIPLIVHVLDQEEMKEGDGPIGLILAPTRELCQQIYHETKKFCKPYNISCCPIYGGVSRWEQTKALKQAPEIVIATPGRMIDFVKSKCTNLLRTTFLVVDEADRMFDMGFEGQVRSIVFNIRPDRQALMFSATFRKRVEALAREALTDPIRICVGVGGEANEDVTQHVIMLERDEDKWSWLTKQIISLCSIGSVIVFVTKKADSEILVSKLKTRDITALLLHGDMDQGSRDGVIGKFKRKEEPLLVATDVASRGLDIPHVRTVINYDVAKTIDTHTHRIGRTGRAGEKGDAYTLITGKDKVFAGGLVRNLEGVNQDVPPPLMQLAMQISKFRKSRRVWGYGKGKKMQDRKRVRPGLGSTDTDFTPTPPDKPSGPLTSRMEMYQAQYKTKFIKASAGSDLASTSTIKHNTTTIPNNTDKPPQRKSRFDLESKQESNIPPSRETTLNNETFIKPPPKKKKRWDS
ncbi:ATP-dependent RNA helicase DDX42-like [Oopsacas minuta]|uniref:RNA helicase n=1 Tax=Oopsacas minuta TaxID=111878 RepID=A0AAV7JZ74_9METZ|nr:ATP-dependent RNA helicase DDX42-like [Oopsacas minuta]